MRALTGTSMISRAIVTLQTRRLLLVIRWQLVLVVVSGRQRVMVLLMGWGPGDWLSERIRSGARFGACQAVLDANTKIGDVQAPPDARFLEARLIHQRQLRLILLGAR